MSVHKLNLSAVELERFVYRIRMRVSNNLVGLVAPENLEMHLSMLEDHFTDAITLEFRALLAGREIQTMQYSHPANWKQALKEEFYNHLFPFAFLNRLRDRLQARFPVVKVYLKWDARELYPSLVFTGHKGIIRVAKYEQATPFLEGE